MREQILAHCGSWMAAIADETVNQFSIVKTIVIEFSKGVGDVYEWVTKQD